VRVKYFLGVRSFDVEFCQEFSLCLFSFCFSSVFPGNSRVIIPAEKQLFYLNLRLHDRPSNCRYRLANDLFRIGVRCAFITRDQNVVTKDIVVSVILPPDHDLWNRMLKMFVNDYALSQSDYWEPAYEEGIGIN
jgi:hypothetical protein